MDPLTFRLNDDGVLLNGDPVFDEGTGLMTSFVDLTKISGFDTAPYREATRDHEGADGGFADINYEQGRDIVLEGTVYSTVNTIMPYLDGIKKNYAPVHTPIPLYFNFPGLGDRLLYVKTRGARYDLDTAMRLGQTAIQFQMFAEDPRFYDTNTTTVNLGLSSASTQGFAFNFGFDLSFGSTIVFNTGVEIINKGNRPAPATIVIPGPITNPSIVSDTVGATLKFLINVPDGSYLTIDLLNHTVKLNGSVNRRGTLVAPDWFLLQPGSNFLRLLADSATEVIATVTTRSAWR